MPTQKIAQRIKVIDTDAHVVEPYDLWTSRLADSWGNAIPHVETVKKALPGLIMTKPGDDVWIMNGQSPDDGSEEGNTSDGPEEGKTPLRSLPTVGIFGMAGSGRPLPEHPRNIQELDPATWDPAARLRWMDGHGIYAQVCYPNVGTFGGGFFALPDQDLKLQCVRAYNDFMHGFSSENPNRLISLVSTPFWDLDATIAEIKRCASLGHKGILFTWSPEAYGMPFLADPFWNPLWQVCSDLELPVNFHLGSGSFESSMRTFPGNGFQVNYAKFVTCSTFMLVNAVTELIGSGVGLRYPKVKFVLVESGVGWIPFVLEMMKWMWDTGGVYEERPELRNTTPLELFQRSIYGTFWFEDQSVKAAIDAIGPDNIMFETDFPHPTCVSPGPNTAAKNPIQHLEDRFASGDIPEEHLRKVLYENAAKLYHVD